MQSNICRHLFVQQKTLKFVYVFDVYLLFHCSGSASHSNFQLMLGH